jgi:hypothetical protein
VRWTESTSPSAATYPISTKPPDEMRLSGTSGTGALSLPAKTPATPLPVSRSAGFFHPQR